MTKLPEKYNDAGVKMFQLLKLLTEDQAYYEKVIELFSNGGDSKANPTVTLNKYMNALKIFGIKIKKYKNKYHLLNSPYTLNLSTKDVDSINLLTKFMEAFPNGKNKKNFNEFLRNIELRYSEETYELIQKTNHSSNSNFKFYFAEYQDLIESCERYCTENFKLKIKYRNDKNEEKNIIAIPQEVKYYKRKICFSIYDTATTEICDIPLSDIINIEQMPTKSGDTYVCLTVMFKLKSRLAKTYKLKDGEISQGIDINGDLIVANKNEDHNSLLKRLMRYGTNCEVISPKSFKNRMQNLIEQTLENYRQ